MDICGVLTQFCPLIAELQALAGGGGDCPLLTRYGPSALPRTTDAAVELEAVYLWLCTAQFALPLARLMAVSSSTRFCSC